MSFLAPTLLFGGMRSPGTIESISGHDAPDDWDVQRPKGSTGSTTAHNGRGVRRPRVAIYLTDEPDASGRTEQDQWADFQRALDQTTAGPTPIARPVYHPDLAASQITEVARANVTGVLHDGRGGQRVTVEFIEYRPPRPKPSRRPKAQGGSVRVGVTTVSAPDPNADKRAELGGLLSRLGDA